MRLIAKIGEYEMDQVILDLGSDVNVLPKKDVGTHGQAHAAMVPYSITDGQPTKDLTNGKLERHDSGH